ncbi:MAG: hypothetical protein U1F43_17130 [Myxococcota bacterium]
MRRQRVEGAGDDPTLGVARRGVAHAGEDAVEPAQERRQRAVLRRGVAVALGARAVDLHRLGAWARQRVHLRLARVRGRIGGGVGVGREVRHEVVQRDVDRVRRVVRGGGVERLEDGAVEVHHEVGARLGLAERGEAAARVGGEVGAEHGVVELALQREDVARRVGLGGREREPARVGREDDLHARVVEREALAGQHDGRGLGRERRRAIRADDDGAAVGQEVVSERRVAELVEVDAAAVEPGQARRQRGAEDDEAALARFEVRGVDDHLALDGEAGRGVAQVALGGRLGRGVVGLAGDPHVAGPHVEDALVEAHEPAHEAHELGVVEGGRARLDERERRVPELRRVRGHAVDGGAGVRHAAHLEAGVVVAIPGGRQPPVGVGRGRRGHRRQRRELGGVRLVGGDAAGEGLLHAGEVEGRTRIPALGLELPVGDDAAVGGRLERGHGDLGLVVVARAGAELGEEIGQAPHDRGEGAILRLGVAPGARLRAVDDGFDRRAARVPLHLGLARVLGRVGCRLGVGHEVLEGVVQHDADRANVGVARVIGARQEVELLEDLAVEVDGEVVRERALHHLGEGLGGARGQVGVEHGLGDAVAQRDDVLHRHAGAEVAIAEERQLVGRGGLGEGQAAGVVHRDELDVVVEHEAPAADDERGRAELQGGDAAGDDGHVARVVGEVVEAGRQAAGVVELHGGRVGAVGGDRRGLELAELGRPADQDQATHALGQRLAVDVEVDGERQRGVEVDPQRALEAVALVRGPGRAGDVQRGAGELEACGLERHQRLHDVRHVLGSEGRMAAPGDANRCAGAAREAGDRPAGVGPGGEPVDREPARRAIPRQREGHVGRGRRRRRGVGCGGARGRRRAGPGRWRRRLAAGGGERGEGDEESGA